MSTSPEAAERMLARLIGAERADIPGSLARDCGDAFPCLRVPRRVRGRAVHRAHPHAGDWSQRTSDAELLRAYATRLGPCP